MIYADNAATTKLSESALEAMLPWLKEEYGNPSQPYSFSRKPKKAIAEAREVIASSINASPEEIYFTSGGTEGDNWAIKGSAFMDCDHRATITSEIEHHAVLNSCRAIEQLMYPVAYLKPNPLGVITATNLEAIISDRTRLVSIMLANNEIGTIQPIADLARIAHEHGSVFHTDAVQAVGHIPVDTQKLGVDMLSASAHKFNGPRGIGFLYIRKGTKIAPYLDGGGQEHSVRAGTENVAAIVGMAEALKENVEQLEANAARVLALEQLLLARLTEVEIPYQRNGGGNRLPGLISLSFPGANGETLLHRMDLLGICISTGSACDSQNTQVSHVLEAIDLDETLAKGTIRISLGNGNTEEDVAGIVQALKKILTIQPLLFV